MGTAALADTRTKSIKVEQLAHAVLGFMPNLGQAPREYDYLSVGLASTVYLKSGSATIVLPRGKEAAEARIALEFPGASRSAQSSTGKLIPGASFNYLIGKERSKWVTGVPAYASANYRDVWPGVDAVFYSNNSGLEYDFVVAPGADPSAVRLKFSGMQSLQMKSGELNLNTASGTLVEKAPVAYQEVNGKRVSIASRAVLQGGDTVAFELGAYDHSKPLTIDPALLYVQTNVPLSVTGRSIAVDMSGNAYLTGTSAPQTPQGSSSSYTFALLFRMTPTGTIAGTIFGGTDGNTQGNAIAVDSSDNVYVTGSSAASNLTSSGFQPTFGDTPGSGNTDAFIGVFTFGSNGSPSSVYSSYIGGVGNDTGNAIAVASTGIAYVAGQTCASNFPTTTGPAYRASGCTAFLVGVNKANSGSTGRVFSTLIGGTGADVANGVAVDTSSNIYVGGTTTSPSSSFLPTSNSGVDVSKTNSNTDGFLTRLPSNGASANWLTFIPNGPVSAVAVDINANAYVAGTTPGSLFQTNTTNVGFATTAQGGTDAFLQRYNPASNLLIYSTYIGGSGADAGNGVAADASGNAFVVGSTSSTNFPVTATNLVPSPDTVPDTFVTRVNTNRSGAASEVVSAVVGGNGTDSGQSIAIDTYGHVYIAGTSSSSNLAGGSTTGNGAYAVKLSFGSPERSDFNLDGTSDIIWQDPSTGAAQVWFLSNPGDTSTVQVVGAATLSGGNTWRIAAFADFNGDGHPDLIWQDPSTGESQAWLMNGVQGNQPFAYESVSASNPWFIAATADFDGDGRYDILWEDPTNGFAQIWFMGGPTGTTLESAVNLTATNPWRIVGAGDFDGDGKVDIVWQDPSAGTVQVWYMSGASDNVIGRAINILGPNTWRVRAVADINGDGHPDLIWQNPSNGQVQVWFMGGADGGTLLGVGTVANSNAWQVVGPR